MQKCRLQLVQSAMVIQREKGRAEPRTLRLNVGLHGVTKRESHPLHVCQQAQSFAFRFPGACRQSEQQWRQRGCCQLIHTAITAGTSRVATGPLCLLKPLVQRVARRLGERAGQQGDRKKVSVLLRIREKSKYPFVTPVWLVPGEKLKPLWGIVNDVPTGTTRRLVPPLPPETKHYSYGVRY